VNPPHIFFKLMGEQNRVCLELGKDPDSQEKQILVARVTRVLIDYLQGERDIGDVKALYDELTKGE
jgi:hypothetical protein